MFSPLTKARDLRASAAMATIAGGKTRKIRQDQLTLLTVVASHPALLRKRGKIRPLRQKSKPGRRGSSSGYVTSGVPICRRLSGMLPRGLHA